MGNTDHYRIPGPNNTLYEGKCNKEGRPHGKGTMRYEDQSKFTGDFDNGSPIDGQFLYNNSTRYIGKVQNLKPHGKGILYTKEGTFEGEFKQGKFINGTILYANNDKYIGHYENGKKTGPAT